jgi:hypothetical protein
VYPPNKLFAGIVQLVVLVGHHLLDEAGQFAGQNLVIKLVFMAVRDTHRDSLEIGLHVEVPWLVFSKVVLADNHRFAWIKDQDVDGKGEVLADLGKRNAVQDIILCCMVGSTYLL